MRWKHDIAKNLTEATRLVWKMQNMLHEDVNDRWTAEFESYTSDLIVAVGNISLTITSLALNKPDKPRGKTKT